MNLAITVLVGTAIGFGVLAVIDVAFLLLWEIAIRRQARP